MDLVVRYSAVLRYKKMGIGVLALIACYVCYPKVKNHYRHLPPLASDQLSIAITNSITNPFYQADTMLIQMPMWEYCGNDEHPEERIFPFYPKLSYESISLRLHLPIMSSSEFDCMKRNQIPKDITNIDSLSQMWESRYTNKVKISILAEKLSFDKVKTYETYEWNGQKASVEKYFNYEDKHWVLE
ncbi:hypothetical protein QNI19_37435 [Cytophagaceae bacterium DM2B3-1]|uniref:Uncharacterized protein n=1 Tax=Xanthocytophaga flava TaxID=3048013 RepID=A0ABT7CY24_9BACT|nr:hypothetical protein [Xanthocytophaga flavus]MDJ1498676.1 hypothetical protein [Xanthocytophaga flavus]